MTTYEVTVYRGKRNWYLKIADYSKTISDEEGKPPACEQAEALRVELAERSHRNRFGWTHIDIQVVQPEGPDGANGAEDPCPVCGRRALYVDDDGRLACTLAKYPNHGESA